MSGRSLHFREGKLITNRKTDRRQSPKRPLPERLHEINVQGFAPEALNEVSMAFALPKTFDGLVSAGEHGTGVRVIGNGFVRVSGYAVDRCYDRARDFFRDIAKDRPGFTVTAVVTSAKAKDRSFGRHLTVVRGAVVISNGMAEPKIYEAMR